MEVRRAVAGQPDFAEYYSSIVGGFLFRWMDWPKTRALRKAFARRDGGEWLLDLGCGSGRLALSLRRARGDGNIVCADMSYRLIAMCRERGLRTCILNLEVGLPFRDRCIDGIILSDVVEHISRPDMILAEIWRILKPKGTLVLFTPPYDSITWLLGERVHHLATRHGSGHISPFTAESLAHLIEQRFKAFTIKRLNFNLSLCVIATKDAPE